MSDVVSKEFDGARRECDAWAGIVADAVADADRPDMVEAYVDRYRQARERYRQAREAIDALLRAAGHGA